jgi:outer membrane protein assembly factor BamB
VPPTRRSFLATAALGSLAGCSAARSTGCSADAATVPDADWPLPRRDPSNAAAAPASATPDPRSLGEQWSTRFDQRVRDPVVVDDTVFTASYPAGGGGRVFALDAVTGERRWIATLDSTFSHGPLTPAVADGTVLVVARPPTFDDGKPDRLYALDAGTGERRWTFDARDLSPPAPAGGVAFLASGKTLLGLDVASGSVCLRTHPTPNPVARLTSRLVVHGRPAVADGTVFVPVWERADSGRVRRRPRLSAFDAATGERRWATSPVDAVAVADVSVADDVVLVPCPSDGGPRNPGTLHAFDAATGQHRWTHETPGPRVTSAAIADSVALVQADGLTALALDTGAVRWHRDDASGRHVVGGPWAFAKTGVDSFGAFDPATGDPVAETSLGGDVDARLQIEAGPVFAGGRAYVRTRAFGGDDPPAYRADRLHALG